jgi:anti-sigma regulatory factor (Ser/Thr protein kinase)
MKQTLEFSSRPENLAAVRTFVRQFLGCTTLTGCDAELLVLGIDEACSNIIRHAYQNHTESKPIILSCERLRKGVRFKLRDFGDQTDPASFHGRPLDRIEPGGLGLHLMRRAFDQVDYNLKRSGTELVLVKRLTS